jgi:alkylation response protein AidB-like acyl-CoA dehydrogenase
MLSYTPPLKDIQFVLFDLLQAPTALGVYPAFADIDRELMQQVVEQAGRFAQEVLFPLNAAGDAGCRYENGVVHTPAGFAAAYHQYCEAGWPALTCAPENGGQGLPHVLNGVLLEMLNSANLSWTMYPGLLHGAYACLKKNASEELQARYLPKIVSGEWAVTMGMTEPHAGSDLGLLRTTATPAGDGSFRITGTKIFMSSGEQDITDNIIHLVLARLPDAPAGSKGLSLFLAPKFLPDGDKLGARNPVHCIGVEHKMGLRGSATCAMQFDGAIAWLIGEPDRGLNAMFAMMNTARLFVGSQAIGVAELAYQNALAYARERVQSRAVNRPASRQHDAADPIVMHPAVQRLLMTQRAYIEGFRMLAGWTGLTLDGALHHPDAEVRQMMYEQLALITPIVKAMCTEQGFQSASQALQVFGGHGFICETGIEQTVRDIRIAMIYEGTNEIQAIDLLVRKILGDGGERMEHFLAQVDQTAQAERAGKLADDAATLLELTINIRRVVQTLVKASVNHPQLPYQIAGETLRLVGHCALAWLWLRAARTAEKMLAEDPEFYESKRDTARYYFSYVLPEVQQLLGIIDACLRDGTGTTPRRAFPRDLAPSEGN